MKNGEMKRVGTWLGIAGACCGLIACGTGCGPSELSRSEAERLIRSNGQFTKDLYSMPIRDRTGAEGVRAGLWTIQGALGEDFAAELTPKGKEYFTFCQGSGAYVLLRAGWKRRVTQVTGIAEAGEGGKEVEFLWEVENVPTEVATVLELGPWRARALLRRYDDGWRVSGIDLDGRGFAERR